MTGGANGIIGMLTEIKARVNSLDQNAIVILTVET